MAVIVKEIGALIRITGTLDEDTESEQVIIPEEEGGQITTLILDGSDVGDNVTLTTFWRGEKEEILSISNTPNTVEWENNSSPFRAFNSLRWPFSHGLFLKNLDGGTLFLHVEKRTRNKKD